MISYDMFNPIQGSGKVSELTRNPHISAIYVSDSDTKQMLDIQRALNTISATNPKTMIDDIRIVPTVMTTSPQTHIVDEIHTNTVLRVLRIDCEIIDTRKKDFDIAIKPKPPIYQTLFKLIRSALLLGTPTKTLIKVPRGQG